MPSSPGTKYGQATKTSLRADRFDSRYEAHTVPFRLVRRTYRSQADVSSTSEISLNT